MKLKKQFYSKIKSTGHKCKLTLKNLITLRIVLKQNLFDLKNKSSIYQQEFNGGVAQLVRARDS